MAIWKLDSSGFGKPKHSQLLWGHRGEEVTQLAFHRDGDILATGSACSKLLHFLDGFLISRLILFSKSFLAIFLVELLKICLFHSLFRRCMNDFSLATNFPFPGPSGSLLNIWCLRSCSVLQTVRSEERRGILSLAWLDGNNLAVCYARSLVRIRVVEKKTVTL